ncbi:unnamed protein product [Amoebophrya sp. A120]|nr:unnamed protein product [Amoebophrya sp. A120]|eukprot:GSA120T00006595001.1
MGSVSFLFTSVLFGYYVSIGTIQLLLTKASEQNGKLQYNTSFVVLLIELFKSVFALVMNQVYGAPGSTATKEATSTFSAASDGSKRKSRSLVEGLQLRYAMPAFFYAVQNNMNILAIPLLHPHIFQLFNNLKIVSAAVFSTLLLRKRYTQMQWLGMALLVVACCVSKFEVCQSAAEKIWGLLVVSSPSEAKNLVSQSATGAATSGHNSTAPLAASPLSDEAADLAGAADARFLLGLSLALGSVATSGMAGVVNEYVLKHGDDHYGFWRKNQLAYQWGVVFNLVPLLYRAVDGAAIRERTEELLAESKTTPQPNSFFVLWEVARSVLSSLQTQLHVPPERLFEVNWWAEKITSWFFGFTPIVWLLILVNVALGVSISLVFRYFDNVVKSFGGPLILFATTFFSWWLFDSSITYHFVLALGLYLLSVYVYVGGKSFFCPKRLAVTDAVEMKDRKDK